jgi:hypothetical protein
MQRQSPPIQPEHLGRSISRAEQEWANAQRDKIAWAQYVEYQNRWKVKESRKG